MTFQEIKALGDNGVTGKANAFVQALMLAWLDTQDMEELLTYADDYETEEEYREGFLEVGSYCDENYLERFTELDRIELKDGTFYLQTYESQGGGEGGGEDVIRVIGVSDDQHVEPFAYVRVTGTYYSYDGTTYSENQYFVFPHEVVVTKFKDRP